VRLVPYQRDLGGWPFPRGSWGFYLCHSVSCIEDFVPKNNNHMIKKKKTKKKKKGTNSHTRGTWGFGFFPGVLEVFLCHSASCMPDFVP